MPGSGPPIGKTCALIPRPSPSKAKHGHEYVLPLGLRTASPMLEAIGAARPYGLMFDAVPPQPIFAAAHVIKVLRAIGVSPAMRT